MTARPIVVLDTSVFLQDVLSKARRGAASQILAIAPAIAHVVMCDEIHSEVVEKCADHPNHLRPGTVYAGFMVGTAHDALVALDAIGRSQ